MRAQLREWCGQVQFDAVVAFSSSMASYALEVTASRRVLDLCDADSQKWLDYQAISRGPGSILCGLEGRRLRVFEDACLDAFDATIVITERERDLFDPEHLNRRLHVVSNGVGLPTERSPSASGCGPIIGFVGALDYRPNVDGICWFAEQVWAQILRCIPDARLRIIGRNPVRRVRRLGRSRGVEILANVPNVRPHLAECRVVIAPLFLARGLQNKVLEAMALRRPIVTTSNVAAALHVLRDHNILVADAAEEYAEKVVALCEFDDLCDKVAEAGYRYAATHHSWSDACRAYEDVVLGTGTESAEVPHRQSLQRPDLCVR
jgi:sugar transferase (PEP-CTERM/EpsH1 system associated)